jgi:dihydrofolate reductase
MGRRTWDCIPKKYRPLSNRVNVVLTKTPDFLKSSVPSGVFVYDDFDDALNNVEKFGNIENVWVIGGSAIYKVSLYIECLLRCLYRSVHHSDGHGSSTVL